MKQDTLATKIRPMDAIELLGKMGIRATWDSRHLRIYLRNGDYLRISGTSEEENRPSLDFEIERVPEHIAHGLI